MNRRALLVATVVVTPTLVVAACGSLTSPQIVTDAEAAANAVSTMAITLEGVVPASNDALLTYIETVAKIAGQDATALGSLIPNSTSTTQTLVQGIVSAITTYDPIITMFFPASAPIIVVLNAALIVGASLMTEAGLTPPAPAAEKMRALAAGMPLDTARAVLGHLHKRTADHR